MFKIVQLFISLKLSVVWSYSFLGYQSYVCKQYINQFDISE